jgi:hypothetical protein
MHLFGHTFDHDYHFELPAKGSGMLNRYDGDLLHTIGISGLSREPYLVSCSQFHSLHHIQYRPTASLRAIATLAIFRPRRIAKWKNLRRHSGLLRAVTCAASTNRERSACP